MKHACILILLILSSTMFFSCTNPQEPEDEFVMPTKDPAYLYIDSDPQGARIWFSIDNTGLTTPAKIKTEQWTDQKEYMVDLQLDGHFPWQGRINLFKHKTVDTLVTLVPAPDDKFAFIAAKII